MYRHSVSLEGQDAGLDMFVGSGIDFLSEVNMEDLEMDTDFFRTSRSGQLSPETFVNYAPLAASLGPPGTGLRLGSDSAQTADTQQAQWNLRAPAAPAQPASLTAGQVMARQHSVPHTFSLFCGADCVACSRCQPVHPPTALRQLLNATHQPQLRKSEHGSSWSLCGCSGHCRGRFRSF